MTWALRFSWLAPLLVLGCSDPSVDVGGGGSSSGTPGDGSTSGPAGSTGTSSDDPAPSDGSTAASTGASPSADTTSADTGPGIVLDVGTDQPAPDCNANASDSIYLLDVDGGLYRLVPASFELESLGTPVCVGADNAMALTIDRNGLLWSMMVGGGGTRFIYTIDPTTLECEQTDFVDPFAEDIFVNSLAFVADAPESESESLYIGANVGGSFDFEIPLSLGRVDLDTMDMTIVGTSDLVPTNYYQIADMTGTGEGRLFGFYPGDLAAIAELVPADASLVSAEVLEFGVGSPWAFAQWAGRLWLFTSSGNPGSNIVAWDPADGSHEELHPGLGISVVGAAVSTCAPFQPAG